MTKKQLIQIALQLIAIFLLIKNIDGVISTLSFTNQLFSHDESYDKFVLLYAISERLICTTLLVLIIIFPHQAASIFVSKVSSDDIIIPIKEQDLVAFGIVIVTGICIIQSFADIITECYFYFKERSSNEYETKWLFNGKNLLTAGIKLIVSGIAFYYRDNLDNFIKLNKK